MFEKKQNLPANLSFSYETNRLVLKILTPEYLRPVMEFQYRNREIFEKYEPTLPSNFYTAEHQQALLKCELQLALKMSTVRFYVFRKEDENTVVGTVCLHDILRNAYSYCEIGYKFDSAFWHQGYAHEAIEMALSIAFDSLDLHRVFARVMPENTPSSKLLLSLGFHEEGTEKECIQIQGKWEDHIRYGLLNPDHTPFGRLK